MTSFGMYSGADPGFSRGGAPASNADIAKWSRASEVAFCGRGSRAFKLLGF